MAGAGNVFGRAIYALNKPSRPSTPMRSFIAVLLRRFHLASAPLGPNRRRSVRLLRMRRISHMARLHFDCHGLSVVVRAIIDRGSLSPAPPLVSGLNGDANREYLRPCPHRPRCSPLSARESGVRTGEKEVRCGSRLFQAELLARRILRRRHPFRCSKLCTEGTVRCTINKPFSTLFRVTQPKRHHPVFTVLLINHEHP